MVLFKHPLCENCENFPVDDAMRYSHPKFEEGLHSLCRIGDELYVEPTKDGISFRTVNSAQSAYSSMFFNLSFFSRYKCDFQTEEAGTCKISMKACLRVFKTPHCMDRNVESCKIEIAEECLKLIFQIQYNQGYTKTHFLSVNDNETVQLKYSKTQMKNEVSILPRTLHRAVKYFGLRDEEITFDVTEDKVHLKNYFDNSEVENQKVVRTNFSLNRCDFETYNVTQPNSITFALRELRAVCAFSESSNSEIGIHFEMCGKPVIFTVENPLYHADYVVSTLPPEIISGERPYRRSQLSDIASSMPSASIVQSSKKRRLAPVNEETAEPVPSLSNESSVENNPIVHVVQADVHQPQTCTSNIQHQSQSNAAIVPSMQQLSQSNATNISRVQQSSQNNAPNISQVKQSSQNNETNISGLHQPYQNDTSNISRVQQPSQGNATDISRVPQFSQSNATNASRVQQFSQNNTSVTSRIQQTSQNIANITKVQRISQNNASNITHVASRCSFGPSNESETNLDELMMRIDVNSEYFQDTNQKTINNELTGLTESQFHKIQHVYQYCMIFPTQAVIDEEILCENDD